MNALTIEEPSQAKAPPHDGARKLSKFLPGLGVYGFDELEVAILAALARRERTGRGGMIDISMQDVAAWMTQSLWNPAADRPVEAPPPASQPPSTVAEACTHPQTLARELIVTRTDPEGRSWEVFGSPMRLSATPARIGTLIGAPCAGPLAWTPRAPDAPPGRDDAARARPLD